MEGSQHPSALIVLQRHPSHLSAQGITLTTTLNPLAPTQSQPAQTIATLCIQPL